ncbi:MAG TPA: hypothetical protein VN030_09605 [Cellvibrio sp.]|nr:hypothetical protein [Cellvibrio sp.]
MSPHIDREPTAYEIWIFKWIAMPIMIVCILIGLFAWFKNHSRCESICEEKGFAGYRYKPSGKYGSSEKTCTCFTEEDAKIKDRVPEGTRVF